VLTPSGAISLNNGQSVAVPEAMLFNGYYIFERLDSSNQGGLLGEESELNTGVFDNELTNPKIADQSNSLDKD